MSEAMMLSGGAKTAVAEAWMQTGTMPTTNTRANLSPAGSINGKYVASLTVNGSGILIAMRQTVSAGIKGKTLSLKPTNQGGSITWTCTSTADAKYIPAACR